MVKSFLHFIQFEKRYSPHTLTSYSNDLNQFSEFSKQVYQLEDIAEANYGIIRAWIVDLAEKQLDTRSINRKIACLRSYYKFLIKKGQITKDPTLKLKAPKIKKALPVFIEEQSMTNLLDHFTFEDSFAGSRDKMLFELLYGTGIRLSELLNLKESDVNFHSRTIKVLGKGNKERIIPLNKSIIETIIIYLNKKKEAFTKSNSEEQLLVTDNGEQAYPMLVYRIVKKYLDMVTTVEKRSPHVLRHTFATHLLNKGADLNAIKDLLGHANLAATQVYTHNSIEKLKSIFNQAHPKA